MKPLHHWPQPGPHTSSVQFSSLYLRIGVIVLFFSTLVVGCKDKVIEEMNDSPQLTQKARNLLDQKFASYTLIDLTEANLFPQLEHLETGDKALITLPGIDGRNWNMELERNNVVEQDFRWAEFDGTRIEEQSPMNIRTFHGHHEGGGPVTLTISQDFLAARWEFQGETWSVAPIQALDKQVTSWAVAFRDADVRAQNSGTGSCLEIEQPDQPNHDPLTRSSGKTAQNCWQIDVFVHGDYQYLQQVNGQTNLAVFFMVASVNEASNKFRSINVHLRVPSGFAFQNTAPDLLPYDASDLWERVRDFDNVILAGYDRDLTMFYTGRNMTSGGSSGVAGVAWTGALCYNPTNAYGVSETINGFYNNRVQAHEFGHLLGAPHDTQCPGGLMFPFVNHSCSGNYPSTNSKNAINWHLWFNHNCIHMAPGC